MASMVDESLLSKSDQKENLFYECYHGTRQGICMSVTLSPEVESATVENGVGFEGGGSGLGRERSYKATTVRSTCPHILCELSITDQTKPSSLEMPSHTMVSSSYLLIWKNEWDLITFTQWDSKNISLYKYDPYTYEQPITIRIRISVTIFSDIYCNFSMGCCWWGQRFRVALYVC